MNTVRQIYGTVMLTVAAGTAVALAWMLIGRIAGAAVLLVLSLVYGAAALGSEDS